MPQVPYNPVPDVGLTGSTPRVGVSTPEAAFGGGIARATEGFGGQLAGVGHELFQRAVQFQELRNETDANNAATDFMGKIGESYEKYKLQLGNNVNSGTLKAQTAGNKALYDQYRAGLANDAARRAFDSKALSTLRYYDAHAVGHTATQTREAFIGSAEAHLGQIDKKLQQATSLDALDAAKEESRGVYHDLARARGWSPVQEKNEFEDHESKLMGTHVKAIANHDWDMAGKLLDKYGPSMNDKDFGPAQAYLFAKQSGPVARGIADRSTSHMEGTSYPPSAKAEEVEMIERGDKNGGELVRQGWLSGIDQQVIHVERGPAQPMTGDPRFMRPGGSFDIAVTDKDDALEKYRSLADAMGLTASFEKTDQGIRMSIDPYDSRKIAPPMPESFASRSARGQKYSVDNYGQNPRQEIATVNAISSQFNQKAHMANQQKQQDMNSFWNAAKAKDNQPKAQNVEEMFVRHPELADKYYEFSAQHPQEADRFERALARKSAMTNDPYEVDRFRRMSDLELSAVSLADIIDNGKLTDATKSHILDRQVRNERRAGEPLQLTRALSFLRDAGLGPDQLNPDAKQRYRESLEVWVEAYIQKNKTMPDREALMKIGRQIGSEVVIPGIFGSSLFSSKEPFYMQMPTDSEKQVIETELRNELGMEHPSEGEIVHAWRIRKRLQQFEKEDIERQRRVSAIEDAFATPVSYPIPVRPGATPTVPAPGPEAPPTPAIVPASTAPFLGGERQPGQRLSEAEVAAQEQEIAGRPAERERQRAEFLRRPLGGGPAAVPRPGLAEHIAAQQAQIRQSRLELLDRQEAYARDKIRSVVHRDRELARIKREREALR